MPRIRTLKPEIWQDEAIGDVCREARLLFVGLITQADDQGRLRGDPRLVGSQVFPYDTPPPEQTEAWLAELDRAGVILRYAHAGRPLLCLPAWERHQRIEKPTKSTLPGPDDDGSRRSPGGLQEESSPERKGEEGKGVESEADASDVAPAVEPSAVPANESRDVSEFPTGGRLSNLLADLIAANDEDGLRPTVTKRWLDAERLLATRDGRAPEQVERVIRWAQADSFESGVVLSMPKLRKRYRELLQKSRRGEERREHKADRRVRELDALGDRFREEAAA